MGHMDEYGQSPEPGDMELVNAYYAGDKGAFEQLFERHKLKVFNFALRLLNNRPDAEDVTSEVFIQLFGKRYQNNGQAQLSTWLLTVARNNCLTRLRSVKKTVSLWFQKDDGDDGVWEVPDPNASPAQAMAKKEQAKAIKRALDKLPIEQKEALILREYERRGYSDIAQILGCSLEKVKVLIFRARERLRLELLPMKGEGL